ncbi:ABC transporter permease [Rhizobium sp.]
MADHVQSPVAVLLPERSTSSAIRLLTNLSRERSVCIGAVIVGIVILAALLAPAIASLLGHGPMEQFQSTALDEMGLPIGPTLEFPLGADGNGRDVLVRTLYGAQVSLIVGIPATTIAMIIGTAVGLVSGFFAGRTDRVISQGIDVALSFPFVVTALSLLSLNRGGTGQPIIPPLIVVIVVISLFSWAFFARLTRSLVLDLRASPMVEASRTLGASSARIIWLDILPNILPTIFVYWAVQLPANIVAEATLSFLGVGIQAPMPSWGNMIAEAQRSSLYQDQPWFLAGPGLALFLTVVGFNTLSAGLRNVLDPHGRRS